MHTYVHVHMHSINSISTCKAGSPFSGQSNPLAPARETRKQMESHSGLAWYSGAEHCRYHSGSSPRIKVGCTKFYIISLHVVL